MAYIGKVPTAVPLTSADIQDGTIALADLSATGTKDATTFLRGDNTFAEAGGGKIGQVLQAVKTDTTSTTSTSFTDLTGITQAITPSATTSKILVMFDGNFSSFTQSGNGQAVDFKLVRDSTDIYIGDAASSRNRTSTNFRPESQGQYDLNPAKIVFLDSPNTTSSTTYKIQWRKCFDLDGLGNPAYLNRSYEDGDNSERPRSASSITLLEVLA